MTQDRIDKITTIVDGYDDMCYSKQLILDRLLGDSDLLEMLNNPKLSINNSDEYYNVNIFSHLINPNLEIKVSNYIAFEVDDNSIATNDLFVNKTITFLVVCDEKTINTKWGMDRHDVIAAIIKDLFNWSNILGVHIVKSSDVADVSKIGYIYREIKFMTVSLNGLTKGVAQNAHDKRS